MNLQLPAGFRFHPTDEELVVHYLCRRCASQPITVPIIAEIDLYKFDPWQLPGLALYGEKEWYFFSPRDRKYPNGSRPNRSAGSGYWKATGADKPVGKLKAIGIKKALVFYAGKAPKGEKTNWIMHEYRLADVDRTIRTKNSLRLDDWVLCRIYNKKGSLQKQGTMPMDNHALMEDELERKPTLEYLKRPRVNAIPHTPLSPQIATSPATLSDYVCFDTSDSERLVSTDVCTGEREVQSNPASIQYHYSNEYVPFFPVPNVDYMSPLQDMFM